MHPFQTPPLRTARSEVPNVAGNQPATITDQAWRVLLARNITVIDIIAALDRAIARGTTKE